MQILFAFIADSVTNLGNESYDVKGLCSTVFIKGTFPTEKHRIVLHVCFRVEGEQPLQEIKLAVRWVDEQAHKAITVPYPFTLPEPVFYKRPMTHLSMPLQLAFPTEGHYRFDILLDGEKVKDVPFEVRSAPQTLF